LPTEYFISIFNLVIAGVLALTLPTIIRWIRSRKQGRIVHQYHKRIVYLYYDGKLDENDIEALDRLRRDITDSYAKGKITEQQFGELKSEISILYEEIYNKKIDSLNSMSDENNRKKIMLNNVKNEIMDAYAKGKITESHYNLLNEKILVLLSYHY
jgi:uncharacterized membrane protein